MLTSAIAVQIPAIKLRLNIWYDVLIMDLWSCSSALFDTFRLNESCLYGKLYYAFEGTEMEEQPSSYLILSKSVS